MLAISFTLHYFKCSSGRNEYLELENLTEKVGIHCSCIYTDIYYYGKQFLDLFYIFQKGFSLKMRNKKREKYPVTNL